MLPLPLKFAFDFQNILLQIRLYMLVIFPQVILQDPVVENLESIHLCFKGEYPAHTATVAKRSKSAGIKLITGLGEDTKVKFEDIRQSNNFSANQYVIYFI